MKAYYRPTLEKVSGRKDRDRDRDCDRLRRQCKVPQPTSFSTV